MKDQANIPYPPGYKPNYLHPSKDRYCAKGGRYKAVPVTLEQKVKLAEKEMQGWEVKGFGLFSKYALIAKNDAKMWVAPTGEAVVENR